MKTYKVESAIYTWNILGTSNCPAEDVTENAQAMLDKPNSGGIINVNNNALGGDPAPGYPKVFAAIVTITNSNGKITTRLCACTEAVNMDVDNAGEVIAFSGQGSVSDKIVG